MGFAKAAQGPVWAMGCCNSAVHGKYPLHHVVAVLLRIRASAARFCSNAIANVHILSQGLAGVQSMITILVRVVRFFDKPCSRSRTSDSGHTIFERGAIYDHDPCEGHVFFEQIVLTLEN